MNSKQTQRLLANILKLDDCWLWLGPVNDGGYGCFNLNNKHRRAHKVIFEYFKEVVPKGMQLDHLCRNRLCVNPDHLEIVTQKENLARGEGPTAINARKTHCPAGHELVGDNLIKSKLKKGRDCRLCHNLRIVAARAARKRDQGKS